MNRLHRWYCRSSFWKEGLKRRIIPWALEGVELGQDLLEVGPGPGLTTEILRQRVAHVTAIEIDPRLAQSLTRRLDGTNVKVIMGDATKMPFDDRVFSGAVAFTMLHHVPSAALQNYLLAEVYRVLKLGGSFAGTDSRWSRFFQLVHVADTLVLVDPATLPQRLEAVGFRDVAVQATPRRFRFRARRPLS